MKKFKLMLMKLFMYILTAVSIGQNFTFSLNKKFLPSTQ